MKVMGWSGQPPAWALAAPVRARIAPQYFRSLAICMVSLRLSIQDAARSSDVDVQWVVGIKPVVARRGDIAVFESLAHFVGVVDVIEVRHFVGLFHHARGARRAVPGVALQRLR